jgi:geranylgeranyl reductase family protein
LLDTDVLVVGGGPAGASLGARLAAGGHDVVVVEKRSIPRHKGCGDALTPRALTELAEVGVDPFTLGAHRIDGVRMVVGDRDVSLPWPVHDRFPDHAAVLRRDALDIALRGLASGRGARVLMGHEATTPIVERGLVRGANIVVDPDVASAPTEQIRSRFVVVADGANSSFGRSLGTVRRRSWPYGIATRTYFASTRSAERWIESVLGIPGADGRPLTGYGWVTPVGDGTINVGVAVLSTSREIRAVNALKLLDAFAHRIADRWCFDPAATLKAPTRFRVPIGGSVGPVMGPTFLVAGDAAGAANPFNGDGVSSALRTGRLAADAVDAALRAGNSTPLQRYPTTLDAETAQFDKVGRLSARFLGRPGLLRPALALAGRSETVMGGVLRIACDERRAGDPGTAERVYALANTIAKFAPNW